MNIKQKIVAVAAILIVGVLLVYLVLDDGGKKPKADPGETTGKTVVVTDEKGNAVTDEKGNAVTEIVTDEATTEGDIGPAVSIDGTVASVRNRSTSVKLEVRDNKLFVSGLYVGETGENRLSEDTAYEMPNGLTLTYKAISEINGVDNGVKYEGVRIDFEAKEGLGVSVFCRTQPSLRGAVEFYTEVTNNTGKEYRIKPGKYASFGVKVASSDKMLYISKESGTAAGYKQQNGHVAENGSGMTRFALKDGSSKSVETTVLQNWNDNGYLPLVYLEGKDSGAYVGYAWSNGRINADVRNGVAVMSVDMDQVSQPGGAFSTLIKANDSLVFPTVFLGAYDGDTEVGSNQFTRWFLGCKSPEQMRVNANEPLSQMDMQSGTSTKGLEAIKWDYGWWSSEARGGWNTLEGSWEIRNGAYLTALGGKTLPEFTASAKKINVTLTTYMLLHDTCDRNGPTDKYGEFNSKTHPQWFTNRVVADGMGASADLGNEECVAFLQKTMLAFYKDNGVTTWRSDFEPIAFHSDKKNRHDANGTDVNYWCTVGFAELVTYLRENDPDFRYESCSSGGSMKDLFTAQYANVINCDDSANYLSLRMSFYDSTYVIPAAQLQMPANSDNFNYVLNDVWPKVSRGNVDEDDMYDVMLDMGYRTICLGAPMFSSHSVTLDTRYYKEYAKLFKENIRPLIRDGELYHVLPRPDGKNYDGLMYVDADSANEIKGALFIFKPSKNGGDSVTVKMRGLDPNATYNLEFQDRKDQNCSKTGKELMEGFTVMMPESIGSEIVWIKK